AESMTQGKADQEQGMDVNQTGYLEILVEAFKASGEKQFLDEAESLAERIVAAGEKYMRMEGCQAGNAFLRLALARHPIHRLEVHLRKGAHLVFSANGKAILDKNVNT